MMGNSGSKSTTPSSSSSSNKKGKDIEMKIEGDQQIYFNPNSPVQLQQGLVDRLSEVSDGPPNPIRQAAIDKSIQAKLRSDLDSLKKLEAEIDQKLKGAFEEQRKLSEKGNGKGEGGSEKVRPSKELMEELNGIRSKIKQHKLRNQSEALPEIKSARGAIISCLRQNRDQPLNCMDEVDNFKKIVRNFESEYITSIQ